MSWMNLKKYLLGLILLFIPTILMAAVPDWKIIPKESSLKFTATQNGAPVSGQFKSFDAEIHFDPDKLDESKVKITVHLASLATGYKDLTDTLITPSWFDIKAFPQAIFEASHFSKLDKDKYQADGTLTIRDKSAPVTLTFTADQSQKDKVIVKGNTTLNRSTFGVGQGEWSSTKEIKDPVEVNFTVAAMKN